ncbi:MAG: hypothetical protein FJY76_02600 [Candidatus Aenigmarchaeota archaeon]|nr:hypothetical protein [Candidatus Aenigmarchaeota archaeon]
MKKAIVITLTVIVVIAVVSLIYVLAKPDLVILNAARDSTTDSGQCKYSVEIKNAGFATINSVVSYCYWPDGESRCRFLSDVLVRHPDTGVTDPLYLKGGETFRFELLPVPANRFVGGVCPSILHFCIDCNLHTVYDKEVIDGTIDESNEWNNDYTYTA